MSFFGGITNIFSGGGIAGTLLKTVGMGYALNKLSSSATKSNNLSGSSITSENAPGIDNGVRLQVKPGANEKIPVLYGSAFFGGIITEAVMSNSNQRMHYVLTLAEKTGTLYSNSAVTSYTFDSIYWDDQLITFKTDGVTVDYTTDRSGNRDASLSGLVKIYCYAGSSSSTNQKFPTGYTGTTANAYSIVSGWSSAYTMSNLIFAVVEVNYSAERNIKGIGDVKFKINTSMNKPGDVIYDYITNNLYGANISAGSVDTGSLANLNTYSATSVYYADDVLGNVTLTNRYQINGLINTDQPVMRNIEDLASSAGSWLNYNIISGKWGVIINKSGSSVASFDDTNIISSISVSGTGLQDLYNSVKAEFVNRDIRDATDYATISIPSGDRNANEQDNTLNIAYNYINEPVQALLLGFIELKQSRIDLIIKFTSDYTTLNLNAGDIVDVTNSKLGFTNKLFRIISIAEIEGDDALQTEITALEYDSTVYDETNLSRYTRSLTNGLITVGNISIPGTPTISKFETAARPRIVITTTAPTSGIIEGMEYWLSNDTGVGEAQRSYRLIATKVAPGGNANVRGTFTSGETVTLDYDTLGTSNLVVKSRAYNSTTVGPYSANSAITSFTSIQATDALLPSTVAYDELGGLLTTLSIVTLLNSLDDLFGGSPTAGGGIFSTIKNILFPDAGIQSNAYTILSSSSIFNEQINSQINSATNNLASNSSFISAVGAQTANIGSYSIDALLDVDTGNINPILNDVLAWDGTNWRPAQTCCPSLTYREPAPGDPGYEPPATPTFFLNRILTYPNDITNTPGTEVTGPGNITLPAYVPVPPYDGEIAPQTGSYYAYFTGNTSSQGGAIYSALVTGTGSVKLYKSNGTLVQTLSAGSLIIDKNRVEFPFADRETGTNYYILMDAGVVKYCPDSYVGSPAITSPTVWNFNTPYYATTAYANVTAGSLDTIGAPNTPGNAALTITGINWLTAQCPYANLIVTFSENITVNSGTVTVTGPSGVVANISGSSATITGATMNFGNIGLAYSTAYTVNVSAGIARTVRSDLSNYACGAWGNTVVPQAYSSLGSFGPITTVNQLILSDYSLVEVDETGNVITASPYTSVSIESLLTLTFNRSIYRAGSGALNISIYESNGTLHQTFNLNSSFNGSSDFTSEIVSMTEAGTTITLNPTKDFKVNTSYYCLISANIIKDSCNINYPGISNTGTITWTTLGVSASSVIPSSGSTNRTVNETGIQANFAYNIKPGTGRLRIYDSGNVLVANISSTNGNVIYS